MSRTQFSPASSFRRSPILTGFTAAAVLVCCVGGVCDGESNLNGKSDFECYRSCTDSNGATQFVRAADQNTGENQQAAIDQCESDPSGPCPAGTSDTGCNCFPPSKMILPDGTSLFGF